MTNSLSIVGDTAKETLKIGQWKVLLLSAIGTLMFIITWIVPGGPIIKGLVLLIGVLCVVDAHKFLYAPVKVSRQMRRREELP